MEVAIRDIHSHQGYKVKVVERNHTSIAFVVTSPDGDAKTFGEQPDTLGYSAYNQAMARFTSLSGWTNHGKR